MSDNSELKYAVKFLRDDAKRHNPHDYADSIQWSAADALEALAGEVERIKLSNIMPLIYRAEAAEAERDRLKAENDLFYAFCNAAWSVGGLDVDWIRLAFINPLRVYKARKALGDAS